MLPDNTPTQWLQAAAGVLEALLFMKAQGVVLLRLGLDGLGRCSSSGQFQILDLSHAAICNISARTKAMSCTVRDVLSLVLPHHESPSAHVASGALSTCAPEVVSIVMRAIVEAQMQGYPSVLQSPMADQRVPLAQQPAFLAGKLLHELANDARSSALPGYPQRYLAPDKDGVAGVNPAYGPLDVGSLLPASYPIRSAELVQRLLACDAKARLPLSYAYRAVASLSRGVALPRVPAPLVPRLLLLNVHPSATGAHDMPAYMAASPPVASNATANLVCVLVWPNDHVARVSRRAALLAGYNQDNADVHQTMLWVHNVGWLAPDAALREHANDLFLWRGGAAPARSQVQCSGIVWVRSHAEAGSTATPVAHSSASIVRSCAGPGSVPSGMGSLSASRASVSPSSAAEPGAHAVAGHSEGFGLHYHEPHDHMATSYSSGLGLSLGSEGLSMMFPRAVHPAPEFPQHRPDPTSLHDLAQLTGVITDDSPARPQRSSFGEFDAAAITTTTSRQPAHGADTEPEQAGPDRAVTPPAQPAAVARSPRHAQSAAAAAAAPEPARPAVEHTAPSTTARATPSTTQPRAAGGEWAAIARKAPEPGATAASSSRGAHAATTSGSTSAASSSAPPLVPTPAVASSLTSEMNWKLATAEDLPGLIQKRCTALAKAAASPTGASSSAAAAGKIPANLVSRVHNLRDGLRYLQEQTHTRDEDELKAHARNGAVDACLAAMRSPCGRDAICTASALQSLANLAMQSQVRAECAERGAIQAAIAAMAVHTSNTRVLKDAVVVLRHIAYENDQNKLAIVEAGGIEAIVKIIQECRNTPPVLRQCCGALSIIAVNSTVGEDVRAHVVAAHGVEAVARILRDCAADVPTAIAALKCLGTLALSAEARDAAIEAGVEAACTEIAGVVAAKHARALEEALRITTKRLNLQI